MRVLIVEDDAAIAEPLAESLAAEGFEPTVVSSGREAVEHAPRSDVVLLDLGLPDLDGIDVCRHIRAASSVPVIVVSARGDEIDRVLLLELGADDYVVKPFGARELVARIRAVLRRAERPVGDEGDAVGAGGVRIDLRARRVVLDGAELDLTPKEFDLLAFLAADPGRAFTRQEILETIWDPHWYGPTKTLDVHVASLRRKLGDPRWIETVRAVGFRFEHRWRDDRG